MKFVVYLFIFSIFSPTFVVAATNSTRAKNQEPSFFKKYLPNTVELEVTNNVTTVDLKARPSIQAKKIPAENGLGAATNLLNVITISKMPYEEDIKEGWGFKWSPLMSFAFYNLEFDSDAAFFSETDFQVFRLSVGLGPEVNYTSSLATIYATAAPGVAQSWVSWSSPVGGGSMSNVNTNFALTVGAYKSISSNIMFRLFYSEVFEDKKVWNEAMDSSQGFEIPVDSVANSILGVSVGYRF